MSMLFSTVAFLACFGLVSSWPVSAERPIPFAYMHTSLQEQPGLSMFDDLNRVMATMNEQFQQIFSWPKFPASYHNEDYDLLDDLPPSFLAAPQRQVPMVNELENIQKQLDAVQPVCTTISDSPTAASPRKSRRKKLPVTRTTTCVKELVLNGRKYYSEEVTTTDEKGAILQQTQNSGSVAAEANLSQAKLLA